MLIQYVNDAAVFLPLQPAETKFPQKIQITNQIKNAETKKKVVENVCYVNQNEYMTGKNFLRNEYW